MSPEFDEVALAVDITVPLVRYVQVDLKQRLNFVDGHRSSAGLTLNLGNRAYVRAAASADLAELSRPLGWRVEGGMRF